MFCQELLHVHDSIVHLLLPLTLLGDRDCDDRDLLVVICNSNSLNLLHEQIKILCVVGSLGLVRLFTFCFRLVLRSDSLLLIVVVFLKSIL